MTIKVDQNKCIGCGACVAIAPNTFDFNEDGLSTVINDELTNEVKEAEEACPVFAIDISGDDCCCNDCCCGDDCCCDDDCCCEEDCSCDHECSCGCQD